MKSLHLKLMGKEVYLANYRRINIGMCMDAMTTSPVESMNQLTKHGPSGVNSNMNLSQSISTMCSAHDSRVQSHKGSAIRNLGINNMTSMSVTRDDVHHKCQDMIDQNYDARTIMRGVRIGEEAWLCWNFDKSSLKNDDESEEMIGIWKQMSRYHNVRRLTVKRNGNQTFINCSCFFHAR